MRQNLAWNLGLLSAFLLLGNDDSAAGTPSPSASASPSSSSSFSYGDYYYNNESVHVLRFHDFEPRVRVDGAQDEGGREGRGFHFNASGDDVSVEMEFIVPFVRVPVKRSMKLARDALQGLLNLRTGALLNTAVIVAAGAIIAAIVRLVLAPMVFTSVGNAHGYGYSGKENEPQPETGNTIGRGMRSLTQVLESHLDEQSIDVSVCAQRAICHYLQRNAAQLQRQVPHSRAPSPARLIDVLANSRWLDSYLNGTAVFGAIDVARSSRSCGHIYRSCSWPKRSWPKVFNYFKGYFSA